MELYLYSILYYLFLFFFGFACFLLVLPLLTVLFSLLKSKKYPSVSQEIQTDFACIITAYRNLSIVNPLLDSILKQQYKNYHIYLVTDDCDPSELSILNEKINVLSPVARLGSKVKSMKFAVNNFERAHEAIIIFDPDNLAHPDLLSKLNNFFAMGYKAVQGERKAKNFETMYACLDAAAESYHNYLERYVSFKIGSSATIAGSGMAIDREIFEEYLSCEQIMKDLDKVILGEDKILQSFLVAKGIQIAYNKEAIIYDEKVSQAYQLERQRTRWINAYFQNTKNALNLFFKGVFKGNFNQLYFGFITFYPPLFLLVIITGVIILPSILISFKLFIFVAVSFLLFVINFLFILHLDEAPKKVWLSLWKIPLFIFRQLKALLNIKKSRKDFLVTQNSKVVFINDVMGEEKENSLNK